MIVVSVILSPLLKNSVCFEETHRGILKSAVDSPPQHLRRRRPAHILYPLAPAQYDTFFFYSQTSPPSSPSSPPPPSSPTPPAPTGAPAKLAEDAASSSRVTPPLNVWATLPSNAACVRSCLRKKVYLKSDGRDDQGRRGKEEGDYVGCERGKTRVVRSVCTGVNAGGGVGVGCCCSGLPCYGRMDKRCFIALPLESRLKGKANQSYHSFLHRKHVGSSMTCVSLVMYVCVCVCA